MPDRGGESQFPAGQIETARESRGASGVRRTYPRPGAWSAIGAALFLAASPLIIWGVPITAVGGDGVFLVASWLICAASAAVMIQRPWRLPEPLALRRCALVLIGMYFIPILCFPLGAPTEMAVSHA